MKMKRIDKRVARRLAEADDSVKIYAVPRKLSARHFARELDFTFGQSFDSAVDLIEGTFAKNEVNGRYLAYYIKVEEEENE